VFATLTTNQLSRQLKGILSNKKTIRFALTAAVGAFLGSIIGYQLGGGASSGFLFGLLTVSAWDACIGIGIGVSIAWVQSQYLRTTGSRNKQVLKTGLHCALGGAVGGAALVVIKGVVAGSVGHVLAWTVEGLIMGWLLAPIFPNLPRKPALIGGMLAGFFGALIGPVIAPILGETFGVAAADSLKGLFLGAMLTFAEKYHAVKDGSLLIHWGKNETSTILLGEKSVFIGNSPDCQVFVKKDDQSPPSVVAEVSLIDGKIILKNRKDGKVSELSDRTIINVGTIKIEVKAGLVVAHPQKNEL
jgi:uncharacterized membrane protein YeaQ/YmgE (transglycosylase-associated protein family)